MKDLTFFEVGVDRAAPIRAALTRLREIGFSVTGDYDEDFRLVEPERPQDAPVVKLALARPPDSLNKTEDYRRHARDNGLRLATLRETASLAFGRPNVFRNAARRPIVVFGDPLRIDGDPETWVPVFPIEAVSLCVTPIGDFWGSVYFPVVKL